MAQLSNRQLTDEVASPHAWRRETARRLLIEREAKDVRRRLARQVASAEPSAAINALQTLSGLGELRRRDVLNALRHEDWMVRRHALRLADEQPPQSAARKAAEDWLLENDNLRGDARLLLQIALSLGESKRPEAIPQLAFLAREHGDIRWMDTAVASSVGGRERELLAALLPEAGHSRGLAETLVATVAARGDESEIRQTQATVDRVAGNETKQLFTRILTAGLAESRQAAERIQVEPPKPPAEDVLAALEKRLPTYLEALKQTPDVARGRELFTEHCSSCHQARGIGSVMGPTLDAEFQRAPETIARDILFPHEVITAGYEAVQLEMRRGADLYGTLASESPTSVTLRFPGGTEMTFLRKRIDRVRVHKASLMPPGFGELLQPRDVADIVSFLRQNQP